MKFLFTFFSLVVCMVAAQDGAAYKEGIAIVDGIIAEVEIEIKNRLNTSHTKCDLQVVVHTDADHAVQELRAAVTKQEIAVKNEQARLATKADEVADKTKECADFKAHLESVFGSLETIKAESLPDMTAKLLELEKVIGVIKSLQEKSVRGVALSLMQVNEAMSEASLTDNEDHEQNLIELRSALTQEPTGAEHANQLKALFARILTQLMEHKAQIEKEQAAAMKAHEDQLNNLEGQHALVYDELERCHQNLAHIEAAHKAIADTVADLQAELATLRTQLAAAEKNLADMATNLETCETNYSQMTKDLGEEITTLKMIKAALEELLEEGSHLEVVDKAASTNTATETTTAAK